MARVREVARERHSYNQTDSGTNVIVEIRIDA